jgi:hypothetical protein
MSHLQSKHVLEAIMLSMETHAMDTEAFLARADRRASPSTLRGPEPCSMDGHVHLRAMRRIIGNL